MSFVNIGFGNIINSNKIVSMITSDTLGMAFEPEQRFENPDGSDIIFDTDIDGAKRSGDVTPGPWA